ncbi:MAG: site-2 protease family protein [Bacilli bacterium]
MFDNLVRYLYIIPAALIAVVLHELGHAFVSYKLGDPTPKSEGRLTLNPLKHLDMVGIICLIFFGFGWAKPVSIDSSYYKNKKLGITLVGLAGPLVNFILAILSFTFIGVIYIAEIKLGSNVFLSILNTFFIYLAIINIGLGVFNLIPIPPLDGSKVIGGILPDKAYNEYMRYQAYGMYFMIGFMIFLFILDSFGLESPIGFVIDKIFYFFYDLVLKVVYMII